MVGIEFIHLNPEIDVVDLKRELEINDILWKLKG
jgi:hypothetical protein